MQLFNNAKIEVIRIGLQNTEEITDPAEESSQVIAGPYHPAFRQLVESGMWYDEIVQKIKKFNIKVMQVTIRANPENIKKGKFEIEIEKTYEDILEELKSRR